MKRQAGLSLMNLLLWATILGFLTLIGFKLVPVYTEYWGVQTAIKKLVQEKAGAPISDIREGFSRRAEIENIKSVTPDQLEIVQDAKGTSISVDYFAEVPLVANVSLKFHFTVEASGGGAGA
jgi:hypothetical protein